MDDLYFLAQNYGSVLIINGRYSHSLEENEEIIKCVKVDLKQKKIYNVDLLQRQVKFGTWQTTSDEERLMYSQILYTEFSDKDIYENIIIPLI